MVLCGRGGNGGPHDHRTLRAHVFVWLLSLEVEGGTAASRSSAMLVAIHVIVMYGYYVDAIFFG